ncbi:hypothetical protein [Streptomyces sp. Ac-502]|uniref:hypothetical protein n=1 Tax=Streptomyces sp. Ac-502 TaxID=3342801 RepID=UPI003862275B
MAIKDQRQVFWRAWIGDEPRTTRERVDLVGGAEEAARLAGVTPRTVKDWIRQEERAIPRTAADAVRTYGDVTEAARAAGVTPRTVRDWMRAEARGEPIGARKAQHIAKLTGGAAKRHLDEQRPRGNRAKLADAVLSSPAARQNAMSSRRAARMSTSGAHLSVNAKVKIDTGRRPDERWRQISLNFKDDVMAEPTNAFLSGDDEGVVDKLNAAFGDHYAPGTDWSFGEFRSLEIKEFGAGSGGTFPLD